MYDIRTRLRSALRDALKARDAGAVPALRSALSAIGNAEAVDPVPSPAGAGSGPCLPSQTTTARDRGALAREGLTRKPAARLAAPA